MTDTNRTPFANAMSAILNHAQAGEGKQIAGLVAMLEMETSFDLTWSKNFHTATGKNKTAMIHGVLTELYPEFADIVETAKQKGKLSDVDALSKEKAQQKVKTLENFIRNAAFAVAFFRVKNVEKFEVKSGRIRYVLDGTWNNKSGDTFKGLVADGREVTNEQKWTAPVVSAGKASTDAGTSTTELAAKSEATGDKYAGAFMQMCNGTANLIEAKSIDQLTESEQQALRRLESVLIRKLFADSKGIVDVSLIADLYNTEPKAPKASKKSKSNGATPPVQEVAA